MENENSEALVRTVLYPWDPTLYRHIEVEGKTFFEIRATVGSSLEATTNKRALDQIASDEKLTYGRDYITTADYGGFAFADFLYCSALWEACEKMKYNSLAKQFIKDNHLEFTFHSNEQEIN